MLRFGGSAGSAGMSNAVTAHTVRSETAVRESGLSWTILRPTAFMPNALRWRDKLREAQPDDAARREMLETTPATHI